MHRCTHTRVHICAPPTPPLPLPPAPGASRSPGVLQLGEDKPFLEILPDVIKSYGSSMMYGHSHTSQSLPRMLTLWFEFGTFLHAFQNSKAHVSCARVCACGGAGRGLHVLLTQQSPLERAL